MPNSDASPPRRSFFVRAFAAIVGAACGIIPMLASALFLADPLITKKEEEAEPAGFLPLGISPDALPDDGSPIAVRVVSDRTDAWNRYANEPIGSVWLRKNEQGRIIAFQATCPHLGCYIDYRESTQDFFCPCHASTFNTDGERQNKIPPRNMDALAVELRNGLLWVRFQNFRGGIAEKTLV